MSIFYNFNRILSYNAGFNFVVGGRGIGKTYGAEDLAIGDALKAPLVDTAVGRASTVQLVYVRRYREELDIAKVTFFDAIAVEFPHWEFEIKGKYGRAARALPEHFDTLDKKEQAKIMKEREWFIIAHFIPLSHAQKYKSGAFPYVKWIIFDEFILEKSLTHYLPDEINIFLNLYNTIARNRKGGARESAKMPRVLFLANSVMLDNPYFIGFKIDPDKAVNGFLTSGHHPVSKLPWVAVHFPDSADFESDEFQTRFRSFITQEMPEYADYAVGNQFADNHKLLIEGKDFKADYIFSLETPDGTFSVWNKFLTGTMYVQAKLPRKQDIYTLIPNKMSESKIFLENNHPVLARLRNTWRTGNMRFDSAQTRNAMLAIFKR